jgi:hypothetical protein
MITSNKLINVVLTLIAAALLALCVASVVSAVK